MRRTVLFSKVLLFSSLTWSATSHAGWRDMLRRLPPLTAASVIPVTDEPAAPTVPGRTPHEDFVSRVRRIYPEVNYFVSSARDGRDESDRMKMQRHAGKILGQIHNDRDIAFFNLFAPDRTGPGFLEAFDGLSADVFDPGWREFYIDEFSDYLVAHDVKPDELTALLLTTNVFDEDFFEPSVRALEAVLLAKPELKTQYALIFTAWRESNCGVALASEAPVPNQDGGIVDDYPSHN